MNIFQKTKDKFEPFIRGFKITKPGHWACIRFNGKCPSCGCEFECSKFEAGDNFSEKFLRESGLAQRYSTECPECKEWTIVKQNT